MSQQYSISPELRKSGIQGQVIAIGIITNEGTVREPVIVESSDPALEKLVIEAILKYRSEPRVEKPAPGRYQQFFNFGPVGIDERVSKYDLPEKTDHPPIEFQHDTLPVVKIAAPVVYPLNLLKDNINGSAKVTVIVDPDGHVQTVEILEATHPEFGLATRGMMQSWKFEPARKNGKGVWSIFALEQKFNTHARGTEVSQSAKEILKNFKNNGPDIHATLASDSLPVALYKPIPPYPSRLLKEGVGDIVMVEFFIDVEGAVQLPHIVEAKNDELAWLALTAVSRWRFEPPLRQGQPIVTRARLPINFTPSVAGQLSNASSPSSHESISNLSAKCSELNAPTYPALSREDKEEGTVTLRIEMDESGLVSKADVVRSSGFKRLDEAAIAAVKTWRCDPPQRNGQPVRAIALQPFNFVLQP